MPESGAGAGDEVAGAGDVLAGAGNVLPGAGAGDVLPGAGAGSRPGADTGTGAAVCGVRGGALPPDAILALGVTTLAGAVAKAAAAGHAAGFVEPFAADSANVADRWTETPGIREEAESDRNGYVAVTVATVPGVAPWQAHANQWCASICCAIAERPSGDVTAMSKSAIVTRFPSELRGTSLTVESCTVRWIAEQNPTGSGSIEGVRTRFHRGWAAAPAGAMRHAASANRTVRRSTH